MEKMLVEIKGGNYSLWDLSGNQNILPARPYVINNTTFIQSNIAENRLKVFARLKPEATDEIFVKYLATNKDKEKAIKEFLKYYDENSKEKLAAEEAKKKAEEEAAKAAEEAKKKAEEAKKKAEEEAKKAEQPKANLFS